MPKRFPIYSRILKLYPKSYREEYGWQMEQTLADMLDDEAGSVGRLQIWAQVSFDLPITIVQQNLIAAKGISMQKHISRPSKKVVIILLAILVLVGGAGMYQYGRSRVIPGVAKVVYGGKMRSIYERELAGIGDPVKSVMGVTKKGQTRCDATLYKGLKTEMICDITVQNYGLLPQDEVGKQRTLAAVKKVEAGLSESGYLKGIDDVGNGVTISSLVSGTYQGKDYSPDAYYQKIVGDYTCSFQTTVAYSNPKPPAINMAFHCYRMLYVFGAPQVEPVLTDPRLKG